MRSKTKKKTCLNIKNDDNTCGKYCVQAVVYGITNKYNSERMCRYKNLEDIQINWGNIMFPMNMCDFDRLEQNYMISDEDELAFIAVKVYDLYLLTGKYLYKPKRISKYFNKAIHKIDLLLIEDEEGNKKHYVLIKDFHNLVGPNNKKDKYRILL